MRSGFPKFHKCPVISIQILLMTNPPISPHYVMVKLVCKDHIMALGKTGYWFGWQARCFVSGRSHKNFIYFRYSNSFPQCLTLANFTVTSHPAPSISSQSLFPLSNRIYHLNHPQRFLLHLPQLLLASQTFLHLVSQKQRVSTRPSLKQNLPTRVLWQVFEQ